jgi:hypothetical protein
VGLVDRLDETVSVIHAFPDGGWLNGTIRRDTLAEFARRGSATRIAAALLEWNGGA